MAALAAGLRRRLSGLPRAYLAANLVLLAAGAVLAALLLRPGAAPAGAGLERAQDARLAALVTALPVTSGGWRGHDLALDAAVADVLRYDWAAARAYSRERDVIWLYVFRSPRREGLSAPRPHAPPMRDHPGLAQRRGGA